nr:MAG TPA: hypothetical protein [Caudoviricetes sp.]
MFLGFSGFRPATRVNPHFLSSSHKNRSWR